MILVRIMKNVVIGLGLIITSIVATAKQIYMEISGGPPGGQPIKSQKSVDYYEWATTAWI